MRRKQATALIDELRVLADEYRAGASPVATANKLSWFLLEAGLPPLTPCPGEAHSNPFIDNCHTCAPRWGWVGPVEVVS